jgi:hypothetical protein
MMCGCARGKPTSETFIAGRSVSFFFLNSAYTAKKFGPSFERPMERKED